MPGDRGPGGGTAPPAEAHATAPRLARPFVAILLATMVAAAAFLWEPWPITSFRLFSHLRYERQIGWETDAVRRDGGETHVAVANLSPGYRNFVFRMEEFVSATTVRRDALCQTWVAPLQRRGARLELRIYRTVESLSVRTEDGDRSAPPSRRLVFVCTPAGAREVAPR